ncbi:TlpA family protein disulfide reductase [Myroides sp. LJL119]
MRKLIFALALVSLSLTGCKQKSESVELKTLTQEQQDQKDQQDQQSNLPQDPTKFNSIALASSFTTLTGETVTLQDILDSVKGSPALIDIWATWCPDCIKAFEGSKKIKQEFPNTKYIYLSLDKDQEKWKAGVSKYDLTGEHFFLNDPKGMKGEFGISIGLNWIPRYIVVDKDSNIALYDATEKSFEQIQQTLKTLN